MITQAHKLIEHGATTGVTFILLIWYENKHNETHATCNGDPDTDNKFAIIGKTRLKISPLGAFGT